jgi:hypothetical protein
MLVNISFNLQKEGPTPLLFHSMPLFQFYGFPFVKADALQCVCNESLRRALTILFKRTVVHNSPLAIRHSPFATI